jgi:Mrp family chromosome partitioning ATPase
MPTLHSAYGLSVTRGLSDALIDPDHDADMGTLVTRIGRNLWLLPAGSRCAAALPHFLAEQLRVRLPQLLATFEYVLVDASSASTHTDVSVLGPLVDGAVLVVEANATRRDAARRVAGQLQAANVRVLGVVLTNRTFPIPEIIYRRL